MSEETERKEESLFAAPPIAEQERMCEAILFATAEPVTLKEIEARMPHGCDAAEALTHLRKRYEGRGVRVVKVGDAWAMRTAPDLGFLMQKETVETRKLSRAAIETLAIISYHQPVTRAEIEEIRGVSVSRGHGRSAARDGVDPLGRRKMTPGRPVTFVVTQIFLDHFGLESARDLRVSRSCAPPAFWRTARRPARCRNWAKTATTMTTRMRTIRANSSRSDRADPKRPEIGMVSCYAMPQRQKARLP